MGRQPPTENSLRTHCPTPQSVVLEISEAVDLSLQGFHFGVEPLRDAVVFGKSPHGGDFLSPGIERVAERHERSEPGVLQFRNRPQKAGRQFATPLLCVVFFQQQITEPYCGPAIIRFSCHGSIRSDTPNLRWGASLQGERFGYAPRIAKEIACTRVPQPQS